MKAGEIPVAQRRSERDVRAVVLLGMDGVSRDGGGALSQEAWCVAAGLFQFNSGRCGEGLLLLLLLCCLLEQTLDRLLLILRGGNVGMRRQS